MPTPTPARETRLDLKRHIAGARAFHLGLIAEAQRRFELLRKLGQEIDCLRRRSTTSHQKLAAAEQSCRHLQHLGEMHRPWRDTYKDLARYMRRVRDHLRVLVNPRQPG
jgi:hypothetical protein